MTGVQTCALPILDDYREFSTPGLTWTPDERMLFTYDHLDRLTNAAPESGATGYSQVFQYNTIGNVTTFAGTAYAYNDAAHKHAVTHLGGVQKYWYDANGSMTTRIEGGVTYQQAWDVESRLTSVTGNGTTTFTYDGDGARVKKVDAAGTTVYVGATEVLINATQRITRTYYSAGAQLVAMRVVTSTGGNTLYYLHTDHLGSASLTTNSSGGEVARQNYYPFGQIRPGGTGSMPTDVGFTGQRLDATGLMFYQARYFSPVIGRFLSADTLVPNFQDPQDFNRFSYTRNNPLKYIDPSGHCITNNKLEDGGFEQTRGDYFDCSFEELRALDWDARSWWIGKLGEAAGSPGWFKNIQTVLAFFRNTPGLNDLNGWASTADAPLLWVIQQGYRLYEDPNDRTATTSRLFQTAVQAWRRFFQSTGEDDPIRISLWGQAEVLGTRAGVEYANKRVAPPTGEAGTILAHFIYIGDNYRMHLATGSCNCGLDIVLLAGLGMPGATDPRTDNVKYGIALAVVRGDVWWNLVYKPASDIYRALH